MSHGALRPWTPAALRSGLAYYVFGVRTGLLNVWSNGLRLGVRKTAGKITQPINAPSRFPEYRYFDAAIRGYIEMAPGESRLRILDVGSPKLLGLYLAQTLAADLILTDISDANLTEYQTMWLAIRTRARGEAVFSRQDARSLPYADGSFDVVYSMSVLEHVQGNAGDVQAAAELVRVLRPGGLLVLSVPYGREYIEQYRVGFSGAAERTHDRREYFFQRIYDIRTFRARILEATSGLDAPRIATVSRRMPPLARAFGSLGENIRGALGFLNPFLAAILNRIREGVDEDPPSNYGRVHSARDLYGDVILAGRKR